MTGRNSIERNAWLHSQMLAGSHNLAEKVLRIQLEFLSQRKGNLADRKKLRDLSKGVCVKMFSDAVLWGATRKGYVTESPNGSTGAWSFDYKLTEKGREWLARGS